MSEEIDVTVELGNEVELICDDCSGGSGGGSGFNPPIPISDVNGLSAQLAAKIPVTEKGAASGVATLDTGGKVPTSQLPSFTADDSADNLPLTNTGFIGFFFNAFAAVIRRILGGSDWKSPPAISLSAAASHVADTANPHNVTLAQVGAAAAVHTHSISDVTDLQDELDSKIELSQKGVANGVATLDGAGKVPLSQLQTPTGPFNYLGTWNASTNSPTIISGTGTNGDMYKVGVAGSTVIDGNGNWHAGDQIIFNGTEWEKTNNYESVNSVNGRVGVVLVNELNNGQMDAAQGTFGTPSASNRFVTESDPTFQGALVEIGDLSNNKQDRSEKDQPLGYAGLNAATLVIENPASATAIPTANAIPIASATGKLDAWVSPTLAATPSGPAGGDLAGTYPNPSLVVLGAGGTGTKITYDTKGRVTSSSTARLDELAVPVSSVNFGNQKLSLVATPTLSTDAATKGYVDTNAPTIPTSLPPSGPAGGDLAGTYPNPTLAIIAAGGTGTKITYDTKGRVTSSSTARLDELAVPTAAVSMGSQKITNLATPTLATDAATKAYVDSGSPANWALLGNASTNPATNFLGTTDNQPLNFKVNSLGAGKLTYQDVLSNPTLGAGITAMAVAFGFPANAASGGGASVLGGGKVSNVNTASGDFSTALGGFGNTAAGTSSYALGTWSTVLSAHTGAFVFSDSTHNAGSPFNSSAANEFACSFSGGYRFEGSRAKVQSSYSPTVVLSGVAIDWRLSNSFARVMTGNETYTFSNDVDGQTIVIAITNSAAFTVTWPVTVKWQGGTAPTQTGGGKTDVYTFTRINGTVYGSVVANF